MRGYIELFMSKLNQLLFAIGTVALLAVAGGLAGLKMGWFEESDPVFTDLIPESRPPRLDRRKLERFASQSMNTILETLLAEEAALVSESEIPPPPSISPEAALLELLPDAPLPFPPGAVPRDPEGLKAFVTGMQQSGKGEPSQAEQWQFNLALSALNIDPEQVPDAIRMQTRPVPESEVFPVRLLAHDCGLSGPFAIGDFDPVEGLEIVADGGGSLHHLGKDGRISPLKGLDGVLPGTGVFPEDYDADGDLDLFICRAKGIPNSLLRNEGNGTFEDVTIPTGLLSFNDSTTAAWLDFDGDDLLDLLVGSRDHPLELFHQTSGGIFQPIAWDSNLWIPRGVILINCADFSGDGIPDLYFGIEGKPDRIGLSQNSDRSSPWRFEELAKATEKEAVFESGSVHFFDFDLDGLLDLLPISRRMTPGEVPHSVRRAVSLLRNLGEGRFSDVSETVNLPATDSIISAGVVDLDNDGYEDLFLGTGTLSINRVFWNQGGTGFREISIASRGSYLDEAVRFAVTSTSRAGSPDIFYGNSLGRIRWLEATGAIDRWIEVSVPAHPPGSTLVLSVRDKDWILRSIRRRLENHAPLLIGLGQADIIEQITVFARGETETLASLEKIEPNQSLTIALPKRPKKRSVVPIRDEKQ